MLKKIFIIIVIIIIVLLGALGYFYYQNSQKESNLQYIQVETGEKILFPKTWTFTTGKEVNEVLNINSSNNVEPLFFASEQKKNSSVFYYVIKEKLNGRLSEKDISTMLKKTVESESKNNYEIKVIDTGLINEGTTQNNKGQFIIYKMGNTYKFVSYFYGKEKELITLTAYLNEGTYEKYIPVIKYIALKNKY